MDKYQIRREALVRLVERMGRGGIAKVTEKTGVASSYVSRLLYPADKKGSRNIGADMVYKLTAAYPDWLNGAQQVKEQISTTHPTHLDDFEGAINLIAKRIETLDPDVRKEIANIFSIYAVSLRATTKADLIAAIKQGEPPKFLKKA